MTANAKVDNIWNDTLAAWGTFRDPRNGLWCDSVSFSGPACGVDNDRYSSAGTGMGLVSEAVAVEVGSSDHAVARKRVVETLKTVLAQWPAEPHTGFRVHWTDARSQIMGEFSTVDTAELVLGARLAGNYFGGEALALSTQLMQGVRWSAAIEAADQPTIYPVVNATTGAFSGSIRPYNEYFLVAYLAKLADPTGKGAAYYNRFFAARSNGPGGDPAYPVRKNYWGYNLLTDNNRTFMSSFIPQFCFFLSRGFSTNQYYSTTLFPAWLGADQKFWELAIPAGAEVWGKPVSGRVFGAGAGAGPRGYSVERIDGSPDLVVSAAIMAGFLPAATPRQRTAINAQLQWLYKNDVCVYPVTAGTPGTPDGSSGSVVAPGRSAREVPPAPKLLWRCSVAQPQWRAPLADSIDLSTLVLGYASNFLPSGFYAKYAL